jgi:hypothetical protein
MFLVCIYSNFKCYHKLNPSTLQIQMILGRGSTETLPLYIGFTVPEYLRTPPFLPRLTDVSTTVSDLMTKRPSILRCCPRYYHVYLYPLFQ